MCVFDATRCDTAPVLQPVDGLGFSIQQLLGSCLAVVARSTTALRIATNNVTMGAAYGGPPYPPERSKTTPSPPPPPTKLSFVPGKLDLAALEASMAQDARRTATPRLDAGNGGGDGASVQGVVALFLPRNTDLVQLAACVPAGCVWQVERAYVNKRLKGITVYAFPAACSGAA